MSKAKILVLFVLVTGLININNYAMSQDAIQQTIPLKTYVGKWYINMTTFPMWLKENKLYPTFNYTVEVKDNVQVLHGDVQYFTKNGKLKHIEGTDKPVNAFNTAFEWRGTGFLKLFKSKWEIIAYNAEEQWSIMHFEKTLATPEGYDLFSKQKTLDEKILVNVNKKLDELGIKGKLQTLKQQ
jgi:lipocalin